MDYITSMLMFLKKKSWFNVGEISSAKPRIELCLVVLGVALISMGAVKGKASLSPGDLLAPRVAIADEALIVRDMMLLDNPDVLEKHKIMYLLDRASASPYQFIRDNEAFSGQKAAAHLRMKYRYAFGRIQTAREFIEHIASRSSLSGKPYFIKLNTGKKQHAEKLFTNELEYLERQLSGFENQEKTDP